MSESKILRLMALGFFICALGAGALFAASNFNVFLMSGAAALLIGAFMAFLLSFAE